MNWLIGNCGYGCACWGIAKVWECAEYCGCAPGLRLRGRYGRDR